MRITSKGQITIPVEIRRRLGLLPETKVTFRVVGSAVRLEKARDDGERGRALVTALRGRATTRLTTNQILALTRG